MFTVLKIGALVNAEAAWSPDSRAFFVTYSDAGMVRTYHVRVVYVTEAGIRVIEPVPNGRRLFRPTCFDPEYPNVVAIGWLGHGSDRLAIAVEVPAALKLREYGDIQGICHPVAAG